MQQTKTRLPQTRRAPHLIRKRPLTKISFDILAAIARYRFIPSLYLQHLVDADPDYIKVQLQFLWHIGLTNRFRLTHNSPFIYYLDNQETVRLLLACTDQLSPDEVDWETIRNNRQRDYANAVREARYGQLLWVDHDLAISRFHAMLELGCRHSNGQVELKTWLQGSATWQEVILSKEKSKTERLPLRPDALFTLHFPAEQRDATFPLEIDRNTTNSTDFTRKLRAYYQFVVEQKKHREAYGVPHIRAVLTETVNQAAANRLGRAATHPSIKPGEPSRLFWFTHAELIAKTHKVRDRNIPLFILQPAVIFTGVWRNPRDPQKPLTLLDQ